MKGALFHFIPGGLLLMFMVHSCSTTQHLPEGEVLYLGTRSLKYYEKEMGDKGESVKHRLQKSDGIIQTLWVPPNGAFLGAPFVRAIPLRLYFYNWFYTEKDSTFSSWMMENFGEPPISISEVNPEARVHFIENQLFNRGYFGVEGSWDLKYKNPGKNKAWIKYTFVIPEAYTFREIQIRLDSTQHILEEPLAACMKESMILPGNPFNLEEIAGEKKRIWEYLQDEGFFYLREDHILILADTTAGRRQVDLEINIVAEDPDHVLRRMTLGEAQVEIDGYPVDENSGSRIHTGSGLKIRKILLEESINLPEGSLYSLSGSRRSIRRLSGLGIFREPVITYDISPLDSTRIHPSVELWTVDMFTLSAHTNLSMKGSSYAGPGLGLSASQNNLLGGAENLTLYLDGYLDFPYGVLSERMARSSGFRIRTTFSEPVMNTPLPIARKSDHLPRRILSLGFEMNNRDDLFRIAEWRASYGLEWNSGPRWSHRLNLVNLAYSNLIDTTAAFSELLGQSELIRISYRDQFILGPSYSFTYNNTLDQAQRWRTYYHAEVEASGNLINGIQRITGNQEEEKKLLGVRYSQYLRLFSDFRAYYRVGNRGSYFAFRNITGVGLAYGNSQTVPYTRMFYVGGTNSLRPITARAVGPGRYLEFNEEAYNQVGDIRLEANLEYRFKIWYILNGALWSDAGNIWLLKEDPERPGSGFQWKNVPRDSYLTSGIGLRADLNFMVLRVDFGAVVYFPFLAGETRWIWNNQLPLYGLSFGIGYPF